MRTVRSAFIRGPDSDQGLQQEFSIPLVLFRV